MKNKLIVITGCSGGGKSALIDSLHHLGYTTIPEAGRIIVKEQMESNGKNLPWIDEMGFCDLLIEKSIAFYKMALEIKRPKENLIFFDRSFLDAISYYKINAKTNVHRYDELTDQFKFDNRVFMTPPWEDIFSEDPERKHTFQTAVSEYNRLKIFYPNLGYSVIDIPKASVDKRIKFILSSL